MKIWTLTPNDDESAPTPQIFYSEAAAEDAATQWVANYWDAWMKPDEEMPADWRDALADLQVKAGFLDGIQLGEHDISDHPDLQPDPYQISAEADKYRAAVHVRDGELEIDDGAKVSVSDDDGAYVQVWVWVSDEVAGLDPKCRTCGNRYSDGGDGFDGECPSCADKSEDAA